MEFPHFMHHEKGTWAFVCVNNGALYIDGKVANNSFYSAAKLSALGVSDGVQCGLLHVLVWDCVST